MDDPPPASAKAMWKRNRKISGSSRLITIFDSLSVGVTDKLSVKLNIIFRSTQANQIGL